jgi:nucleoside 2-deoxyribosyltransferase
MDVYFAAPLFSEAELEYNERVSGMLESEGHSVFLPQRDGFESVDELRDRPGIDTEEDVLREIFRIDREAILDADIMTAILDGQVPDEGVAVEIGIANEIGLPMIGLKTDDRNPQLNAMVFAPLDEIVETPDQLVDAVNDAAGTH